MSQILLIDGHNIVFRAFYGIRELSHSDNFPINAIYGFTKTVWRLMDRIQPDQTIIFFDQGHSQARQQLLAAYKAQRPPMPEPLRQQLPVIKELVPYLGLNLIQQQNVEADDLLASVATQMKANHTIHIASADKDFAQIVDESISQWCPPPPNSTSKDWIMLSEDGVEKKFGVRPRQIVDYLSIVGDSADNIPGLPGIGPKTTVKWLQKYGTIEGIYQNLAELSEKQQRLLKEFQPLLDRNRQLIQLNLSYEIPSLPRIETQWRELEEFFSRYEIPSLKREVQKRFSHIQNIGETQLQLF